MAERPKSLLGLPITGDYNQYNDGWKPQKPLEELLPFIQKMLDDENVAAFGWTQYTPYFNDGEPCVFHTWGTWAITYTDLNGKDFDRDEFDDYDYEISRSAYNGKTPSPSHHLEFANAIEGGEFYGVLLGLFGDPAEVTFDKKSGEIHMEFVDHE